MQDYKYLHYKSKQPKSNWPKKLLIMLFVTASIAVPASIYLKKSGLAFMEATNQIKMVPAETTSAINEEDVVKRFTFYDILATGETIIQDEEQLFAAAASNKVFLQLNAFKTAAEADDFQVRIKMIELNPTVESLFLKDKGGQWFVVRLGPLENDDEITRTKALLKGNGYKFAVVLRKS
jgi:cell division septation protein DedD